MKLTVSSYCLENEKPFRIAHGARTFTETLFVQFEDEGFTGIGEASHVPYYGISVEESISLIKENQNGIIALFGRSHKAFWEGMNELLGKNHFAKCAVDIAYYDWRAQKEGLPLWSYLGLSNKNLPKSSFTIGMDSHEEMGRTVLTSDFPSFKIKLGGVNDMASLEYLRSISAKPFKIDVNGAWSVEVALEALPILEKIELELIEQPLDRASLKENNVLRERTDIPIFADESCFSLVDVKACAPFFDGINIKLSKCGGIYPALEMIALARSLNLKLMMGCMTESSVGISTIAHLSSLVDFIDMDGSTLLKVDPADGVGIKSGVANFNKRNGHGSQLKERFL